MQNVVPDLDGAIERSRCSQQKQEFNVNFTVLSLGHNFVLDSAVRLLTSNQHIFIVCAAGQLTISHLGVCLG